MFSKINFRGIKVYSSKFLATVLTAGMCVCHANAMISASRDGKEEKQPSEGAQNSVSSQLKQHVDMDSTGDVLLSSRKTDGELPKNQSTKGQPLLIGQPLLKGNPPLRGLSSKSKNFGPRLNATLSQESFVPALDVKPSQGIFGPALDFDPSEVDFGSSLDATPTQDFLDPPLDVKPSQGIFGPSLDFGPSKGVFGPPLLGTPVLRSSSPDDGALSLGFDVWKKDHVKCSPPDAETKALEDQFTKLKDSIEKFEKPYRNSYYRNPLVKQETPKSMKELVPSSNSDESVQKLYNRAEYLGSLWERMLSVQKSAKWILSDLKGEANPLMCSCISDVSLDLSEENKNLEEFEKLDAELDTMLRHVKDTYMSLYRDLLSRQKEEPEEKMVAVRFSDLPNPVGPYSTHFDSRRDRYENVYSIRQLDGRKAPRQIMDEYVTKNGQVVNATKVIKLDGFSLIATQAPLRGTFDSYLDLLSTSGKIDGVVVLGTPGKDWNARITPYFIPGGIGERYKESHVCEFSEEHIGGNFKDADVHKYMMKITPVEGGDSKVIPVYNFTAWPDGAVPTNRENFENFVKLFTGNRKLVVHCSAGIGRTGVFASYLYALKTGEHDPFKIVSGLRQYRVGMVQTKQQFDFLSELLKDLEEKK